MKTAGRIGRWVIAVAAIVVGVPLLYLTSDPGQRWIKGIAERKIAGALDATVSIAQLETNIFNRLEVRGVEIQKTPPDGTPVSHSPLESLRIDRLRVRYGLFHILFDGFVLDSVFLEGARVSIFPDSIPAPPASADSPAPTPFDEKGKFVAPIRLRYADLSNVQVEYADRSIPLAITGANIGINIAIDEDWRGDFHLEADSVRVDSLDRPVNLTNLVLNGTINRDGELLNGEVIDGTANIQIKPFSVKSLRFDIDGLQFSGAVDARPDLVTGRLTISGDPRVLLAALSEGLDESIGGGPILAEVDFAITDPTDTAKFQWSIGVPSVKIETVPVTNLRYNGGLRGDTLTVDKLTMSVYVGTIEGSGWIALDGLLPYDFGISAKSVRVSKYWASRTKPGQFTRIPVTIDARVDSRGNLSTLIDMSATSDLSISTGKTLVAAPTIRYSRRHLSVRSTKGMAYFDAEADLRPASARKGGAGMNYDGTVELSVLSMEALKPVLDLKGLDGSLEANATVSGKGSRIDLASTATSDGISYKGVDVIDELSASVRLDDEAVIIDSATVAGWAVELEHLADALGVAAAHDSAAQTDHIAGTLTYSLTAQGPIDNPRADFLAGIAGPKYGAFSFDTATVSAVLADSVVRIRHAGLRKGQSEFAAEGDVDLRNLAGSLVTLFRGPGPANGGAGGGAAAPIASTGLTELADTVRLAYRYDDAANYSFDAVTGRLGVAALRELIPGIPIDGGQVAFDARIRNAGDSLDVAFPFAFTGLMIRKGTIDSIAGTVRYAGGTITVDSVRVSNDGRRLVANATLELGRTPDGSYAVDWDSRTKGSFTGDTVDLSRLNPFLASPVELGGAVDLDLRWDGVVKRPKFRGTVAVDGVRYGSKPKSPWFTDLNGTLRLGEGAARSDSMTAKIGKVPILVGVGFERGDSTDFTASVDLATDSALLLTSRASFTGDSVDVLVESKDLNLSVVQPFVEKLRKLAGRISTRMTLKGPVASPTVEGTLNVSGVSFEPGTSGVALTEGAVSARLTGGKLVLDSARAVVGGGRIFASGGGEIDSGKVKNLNMNLTASALKITKKGVYQINVKNTDLKLASAKERYKLTGKVEFGETKFVRDIEIGDIVEMMSDETVTDPLAPPKKPEPLDLLGSVTKDPEFQEDLPDFAKKVDFDIELKNAEGLWVDNNLANFRSLHDLHLQGNFQEASLTGRIDVRDRGELIFLDRRFEILNGVVDCSDPHRLNPVINLTAQTNITEQAGSNARPTRYTITLTVAGPLDDFEYELTSKPSLERADIISLLALGMTQYALESGGNKDDVYKDRSEVVASQQISNSVNRFFDNWLGDFLALDHIGIGGNLFDPNETRFEVTKRWSDRVEIRYSTSISNVDEQILSAEYRINDWLYLEGKTDQQEDSGADLKFRIWFK